MIRVGICDDDPLVRQLIADVVGRAGDLKLVATCSTGEESIAFGGEVDVWLMDQRLPGMTGSQTCRVLTSRNPAPRVLILTSFATEPIREAIRAGACGYLYKDEKPERLHTAIRAASAGFTVHSAQAMSDILGQPPERPPVPQPVLELGDDDRRILCLVLAGHPYRDIAERVDLSESGLKKRLAGIMQRMGVKSRPQLMAKLREVDVRTTHPTS